MSAWIPRDEKTCGWFFFEGKNTQKLCGKMPKYAENAKNLIMQKICGSLRTVQSPLLEDHPSGGRGGRCITQSAPSSWTFPTLESSPGCHRDESGIPQGCRRRGSDRRGRGPERRTGDGGPATPTPFLAMDVVFPTLHVGGDIGGFLGWTGHCGVWIPRRKRRMGDGWRREGETRETA